MTIASNVLFVVAFLGFVAFSLLYALRSPWRSTSVGRNAMALMVVGAVLMGLGVLRMILGGEWFDRHRDFVRLVSYSLISYVVWWRVILLIKLQRPPGGRAGVPASTPTRRDQ